MEERVGLSLQGEGAFDSNPGSGDLLPSSQAGFTTAQGTPTGHGADQCPAPGGLRVFGSEGFEGKHSPWGHLK